MFDDIEPLISNSEFLLSQVLLLLNIYRKTGSSEKMTNLNRLDHELSFTETKFIRRNGSNGEKNNPS